jgi:hypothetical protein
MKKFLLWALTFVIIYAIIAIRINDYSIEFRNQLCISVIIIMIYAICVFPTIESGIGTHIAIYKSLKKKDTTKSFTSPINIRIKGCDFSFLRGGKYLLEEGLDKDVLVSMWNLIHFFGWMIAGYICPKLFLIFLFVGIWWEFFETFKDVDCHDYSDVLYNIVGLTIGIKLRDMYDNRKIN